MLRRLIFALILIAAAFAGGAAINGPGLAWLHRTVLGGPTILVDGAPTPSASSKPPKPFPTAKTAPLAVDLHQAPPTKTPGPALEVDPPLPLEAPAPDPAPPTRSAVAKQAPTGLDPGGSPPADRLASAERRGPPAEPPSISPPNLPSSGQDPAQARGWAEIRRRMRTLGIARYTIEAETDGRVRFSCVIPVEGLRAVGHHFEAEGDDEYQAAEAALSRIALWQATEAK
jgi:hypothetical protein